MLSSGSQVLDDDESDTVRFNSVNTHICHICVGDVSAVRCKKKKENTFIGGGFENYVCVCTLVTRIHALNHKILYT